MFNAYYSFYTGGHFTVTETSLNKNNAVGDRYEYAEGSYYLYSIFDSKDPVINYSTPKMHAKLKEHEALFDLGSGCTRMEFTKVTASLAKLLRNLYCNLAFDFHMANEPRTEDGVFSLKSKEAKTSLTFGEENGKYVATLIVGKEECEITLTATEDSLLAALTKLNEIVEKLNNKTATLDDVKLYNPALTHEKLARLTHIVHTGLTDETTSLIDSSFDESYNA